MLSLIVPTRNWPAERIDACLRSFLRLKSKTLDEIVVVDFGSEQPVTTSVRDKRIRIVRVQPKRWSLAEAINVGVTTCRNPIVAKTDADIIVARESGPGIDETVARLAKGDIGLAVVQAIDLPETIDANGALASDSAVLAEQGRLRARWGQGGLCLFTVDAWQDLGGFEARFYGWGNEDNDFFNRIKRSGRNVRWIKPEAVRIFHVWHPPSYATKDIIKARADNRELYNGDKSTYRTMRFPSAPLDRLPSVNLVHRPKPLVTVALASKARNKRNRMLSEAIRGFAGQIDNDFEILIANNGSTAEETESLRASLKRLPRGMTVRVIDIDQASIPMARNRLTDEARGRYICVADDDDIPLPNRLADHLACFEANSAIHGSHGGWIDFDEVTGVIDFNTGGERSLATLMFGRGKVTAHPTAFYRRDVLQAIRYDEAFSVGSDLDLALRMGNMGCRIEHTGSYVTLRRFHHENVTITDLGGQLSVGQRARQRIGDTLGHAYEWRLKEMAKKVAPIVCRNGLSKDRVIDRIPSYAGVWRLLVPLTELGRQNGRGLRRLFESPGTRDKRGEAGTTEEHGVIRLFDGDHDVDQSHSAVAPETMSRQGLVDRAGRLAELVRGDVGVVDCGIDPSLYIISQPIRGAGKAMRLRKEVEQRFSVAAQMVPDVEYRRRHTTRFDWHALAAEGQARRLVSRPTKDLNQVLSALARLPGNTMLRAMTVMLADFNCEDQLYHLVTMPIPDPAKLTTVRRALEQETGEPFDSINEIALRPRQGRLS